MKQIKVGSRVHITGSAGGTCWEYGYVVEIINGEALINFGSTANPIYGMGIRKPLDQLELVR